MLMQGACIMLTIIFHLHIYQCVSQQRGYCYSSTPRSRSDGKSRGYDCCDNFEDINNTCTECKDGYQSSKGTPCQPCDNGLYGRRCVDLCNCEENERCHNVYGCIKDFSDNLSTSAKSPKDKQSTQDNRHTTLQLTSDQSEITSRMVVTHSTDASLGLINSEVFIYLLCGVSAFFILSFSIVCWCVHRKSNKAYIDRNIEVNQSIDENNHRHEVDIDLEIRHSVSIEMGTDHEYEEIDEQKMSEFFVISSSNDQDFIDNENSSESSDGIRLPDDGYLNPYQPLQYSLRQSEDIYDDSDECNHPFQENKAYANLYQSLESNRGENIRLYSRCQNVQYLELVDVPIQNKTDPNMKENCKRHVHTL
ncbi:unnamed protein product [Mytilus coruscus]|uniref:MEGF10_11 n=1 Tax=Mytilus coruscus TaxID=42192 RepID=A0A6J8EMB1_MYTCO|nr:unnamed protein product [Mytilus coruscus]